MELGCEAVGSIISHRDGKQQQNAKALFTVYIQKFFKIGSVNIDSHQNFGKFATNKSYPSTGRLK